MLHKEELAGFLEGAADPAFAIDLDGVILAWNRGAEEVLGYRAARALGRQCSKVVCGTDEGGAVCAADCIVRHAIVSRRPLRSFDLQIKTRTGKRWFSCSVIIAGKESNHPFAIYVLRSSDSAKRLEQAVRQYVHQEAGHDSKRLRAPRMLAGQSRLTRREMDVLRLMATGSTTGQIATRLRLSRFTVNNHIQHILRRLGAHTRLEAVRRAEAAGLL